ncbi:NAD(P)-dependent dehydrogenase (short-subunit alcohol dehydrogenase family) [Bradyrhizobium sp. S3.2.6]|uniref:SDR family NAD(P)-dependent oxidoreductase n=1 Tax=Bradyrhizobium sp. S3.2.6 TaxID=3156428 RepID=UPI0033988BBE
MNEMAGFNRDTTADEVLAGIDLSGKVYLVTGASSGLGQETARVLASRGAKVIMAVRSRDKGEAAATAIRTVVPGAALDVRLVDLASLASVRAFTATLAGSYGGLDGIVANAGVMAIDHAITADGFEMQFGANHLGHFLLVNRLAPLLEARAPSRLVVMTSGAHRLHNVDLEDPNFHHKPYDRWDAYGQSKSANALFALAFDAHHRDAGVRAFTVAPGIITDTNLHHHLTQDDFAPLRRRQPEVANLPRKTLAAGAATMLWALVHPELDGLGGRFLEDCGFSEVNPDPRLPNGIMPWALDQAHAEAVWGLSERLVGEFFARTADSGVKTSATALPSSAAVASGLSVNRQPSTNRLQGRTLEVALEADSKIILEFLPDGVLRWRGLPGLALDQSGFCPVDVVEAAPDVLLIVAMLPAQGRETMAIVLDLSTHHVLFVASQLADGRRPFERKTRVTQRFTKGQIRSSRPSLQSSAPEPTRDLIGTRAIYRYSEDTVYEHLYLNTHWYSYQCLKGVRRGDCGTDEASYWKIRDDIYVVTWREILIDLAATFVYDMKARRSTGCAWGTPGGSPEPRHILTGAFFEKLKDAGYPADIELI